MFSTLKKRALLKIYCTVLFVMLSDNMLWAILIPFAIELKANVFQINLITTISSTMSIALQVPFGILSDRYGRRPMMIRTRLVTIVGQIIRVFAVNPNDLLIASLLGGFSGGDFFPVILSMLGDMTDREERQQTIGTMYVFSGVGMLTGPALCSFLLLLPQITLRNINQLGLVIQIVSLIFFLVQVKETKPRASKGIKANYRANVQSLITQKSFQGLILMTFFLWFSRSTLNTYIQIYSKVSLHLSDAEVASFTAYTNGATMLIRFFTVVILTRFQFRPALIAFLGLGAIAGFSAPFASTYTAIVIIQVLSGISYGAARIFQDILAANNSTSENRGMANSLIQLSSSIGNLSRTLTTPVVDIYGFVPIFTLAGIGYLIASTPPLLNKVGTIERKKD